MDPTNLLSDAVTIVTATIPCIGTIIVARIARGPAPAASASASASDQKGVNSWKRGNAIVVLLAVLIGLSGGVLGSQLIVPAIHAKCLFFQSSSAPITSPLANNQVDSTQIVRGTSCNLPSNEDLWVFIEGVQTSGYYPQAGPIAVSFDGTWEITAYIGAPSESKADFRIITILANSQANAAIQAYMKSNPQGNIPLEPLPKGIQFLNQIEVTRK